jgi:sodium transport system ATP-binding protein
MDVLLSASGLTKRFGAITALDDVTLSVRAGEVVGLLGPNGAGKTTALRILAGILTPDSGQAQVAGEDVRAEVLAAKARIGFLSGDTQLYHRLSPREVLVYFGRLYGLSPERLAARITTLIAELEMGPYADRPCGTLSSGQKQRANLARAFLHEPEVLILDEPTMALDVVSGHFIVEAILRQRALGRAILFSTHVMGEAEQLCDRIYLLHEGRIVDHGTQAEILSHAGCTSLAEVFFTHASRVSPPASAA